MDQSRLTKRCTKCNTNVRHYINSILTNICISTLILAQASCVDSIPRRSRMITDPKYWKRKNGKNIFDQKYTFIHLAHVF